MFELLPGLNVIRHLVRAFIPLRWIRDETNILLHSRHFLFWIMKRLELSRPIQVFESTGPTAVGILEGPRTQLKARIVDLELAVARIAHSLSPTGLDMPRWE